jgi:hypothetical protein
VKYWEIIADNLSKAGWSWSCVSTVDSNGRTIFVADAHREGNHRFIVRADEKLTVFLESAFRKRMALPAFEQQARDDTEGGITHLFQSASPVSLSQEAIWKKGSLRLLS